MRTAPPPALGRVVVVGAGMVAHRLVAGLVERAPQDGWHVTVLGDEPWAPYDRVHLSELVTAGRTPDDLALDPTV